ncbi:response regulator [Bacillaceae bacterium W0354]
MSMLDKFNVLLIEDDPMVQEVNRNFIEQVSGFEVISTANNGKDGLEQAKELKPDLVILDIYMPELDGVETLQSFRKLEFDIDVIVITAANDRETIRKMFQYGVVDYVIKPFKFERLKRALQDYKAFKQKLMAYERVDQSELDQLVKLNLDEQNEETLIDEELPKGLNEQTLKEVIDFLLKQDEAVSAEKAAEAIGIARVTARRYLEYLQSTGKVKLDLQYGTVGRPLNRYILAN